MSFLLCIALVVCGISHLSAADMPGTGGTGDSPLTVATDTDTTPTPPPADNPPAHDPPAPDITTPAVATQTIAQLLDQCQHHPKESLFYSSYQTIHQLLDLVPRQAAAALDEIKQLQDTWFNSKQTELYGKSAMTYEDDH